MRRHVTRRPYLIGSGLSLVLLAVMASRVDAQPVPVGSEFMVNTYTTGRLIEPGVAAAAEGGFVVVWPGYGPDDTNGMVGQRYDSGGVRLGAEFQVNSYTTGYTGEGAHVAAAPGGAFVVVWRGSDAVDNYGVFGRRFDSAGMPQGNDFRVNTYTTSSQRQPRVAVDADGGFVVVWDGDGAGDYAGVFGQRYDSGGAPLGSEFQANSYQTSGQRRADVAADADGDFVVVWSGQGMGDDYGVFGQRYDSAGAALGEEFRVNSYTTGTQNAARVAADNAGNFVVVWHGPGVGDDYGVFAQRYDSSGAAAGVDFQVNGSTTGPQRRADVGTDAGGNFVVVWEEEGPSGGGYARLFGHRYDSTGGSLGGAFDINMMEQAVGSAGGATSVAVEANGDFVVVWTVSVASFSAYELVGRRFATPCGNGAVDAGEDCDDGNRIDGDCCNATCQLEPVGTLCADDGDVCTDDVCDGAGTCEHPDNTAACDDGDGCTTQDICMAGTCIGMPADEGELSCQLDTLRSEPCPGEDVPKKVTKRIGKRAKKARRFLDKAAKAQAAGKDRKAAKFRKRARKQLAAIPKQTTKAVNARKTKQQISESCKAAIDAVVNDGLRLLDGLVR